MLVDTEELKRVIQDWQRREVWGRCNLYWLVRTDLSEGEVSELRPEGVSQAQEPSRQRKQYIKQFILGNPQVSLFSSLSNNCSSFLQWNFYFSQVIFYENSCSCAYFTQLDTSTFRRLGSLPESHPWAAVFISSTRRHPCKCFWSQQLHPSQRKYDHSWGQEGKQQEYPFWRWRNWDSGRLRNVPDIL